MKKIISILFIGAISAGNLWATTKIIYGTDDRKDLFEVTNPVYKKLALSTAAMIENSIIVENSGKVSFRAQTLGEMARLCPSEKFRDQQSAAVCSGFLIGPDLLVTAGHCIENMDSCNGSKWVFDYAQSEKGGEVFVPASSVYSCKSIVSRELTELRGTEEEFLSSMGGTSGNGNGGVLRANTETNDYAIIRLDRKVSGREPLKFRKTGKISVGEDLVLIGYPSGLPLKVAAGGKVTKLENKFFIGTVDAFGGNSGSAVFNAKSGEIEGILVRGNKDYRYDFMNSCNRTNVVAEGILYSEGMTYIGNLSSYLK